MCAQFVVLCRQLGLFTRAVVAIDGSKFKAVNNRDKNFTVAKVAKRLQQVDASIVRYLTALDRADRVMDKADQTVDEVSAAAAAHSPRLESLAVRFEAGHPAIAEALRELIDALVKAGI